ncbi:MAG: hypothetical protein LBG19_02245 [Prevotellaceae bacterium]|jgi:tetratricopeptide (TPR) repeat protein|nr:hypothetical protein [Prevotellaceae bacterium]
MLGADISGMGDNVANALSYFVSQNDAKNIALACYVQAKVYEANGQIAYALSSYESADFWAEKASYNIPHFTYIAIPYNIASYHKRSNRYQKSLSYLYKAVRHADTTRSNTERTLMLYTFELMGIDYMYLNKPDSSFYYYDKAFEFADQIGAVYPKQRITGNRIEMLSNLDDMEFAEAVVNTLLKDYMATNDSAFIASTNLSLAKIYTKTNRIDEAYQCIDKALAYADETDFDNHRLIYDQMILLAQVDSTNTVSRDYYDFKSYVEYISRTSGISRNNRLTEEIRKKAGELLSEAMKQNERLFLSLKGEKILSYIGITTSFVLLLIYTVKLGRKNKPVSHVPVRDTFDVEEAAVIEYILQYELKKDVEQRLIDYVVKHNIDSPERENMLDDIEIYKSLSEISVFDGFKKRLFGEKYQAPILQEQELFVCYLMCTNRFPSWEIESLMNIKHEQLLKLVESLESKMLRYGYMLPDSYHKAKRKINKKPSRLIRDNFKS